jgi:hypothetical protein
VFHGVDESHTQCTVCELEDTMQKLFTNSFVVKRNKTNLKNTQRVGALTKEYIEKNREILKTEQEKAKRESHDPT